MKILKYFTGLGLCALSLASDACAMESKPDPGLSVLIFVELQGGYGDYAAARQMYNYVRFLYPASTVSLLVSSDKKNCFLNDDWDGMKLRVRGLPHEKENKVVWSSNKDKMKKIITTGPTYNECSAGNLDILKLDPLTHEDFKSNTIVITALRGAESDQELQKAFVESADVCLAVGNENTFPPFGKVDYHFAEYGAHQGNFPTLGFDGGFYWYFEDFGRDCYEKDARTGILHIAKHRKSDPMCGYDEDISKLLDMMGKRHYFAYFGNINPFDSYISISDVSHAKLMRMAYIDSKQCGFSNEPIVIVSNVSMDKPKSGRLANHSDLTAAAIALVNSLQEYEQCEGISFEEKIIFPLKHTRLTFTICKDKKIVYEIFNPFPLKQKTFEYLLLESEFFVGCTGDGSLSQVLSSGRFPMYDIPEHKNSFALDFAERLDEDIPHQSGCSSRLFADPAVSLEYIPKARLEKQHPTKTQHLIFWNNSFEKVSFSECASGKFLDQLRNQWPAVVEGLKRHDIRTKLRGFLDKALEKKSGKKGK